MENHTQHLTRPEGRLGYDVRGEGPLVVSAPGVGDLRSSYRFLAPALVDAGFRVATVDLRGHYPQAQRPDVAGPAVAAFLATVRGA